MCVLNNSFSLAIKKLFFSAEEWKNLLVHHWSIDVFIYKFHVTLKGFFPLFFFTFKNQTLRWKKKEFHSLPNDNNDWVMFNQKKEGKEKGFGEKEVFSFGKHDIEACEECIEWISNFWKPCMCGFNWFFSVTSTH